jgi:hypothetical protein
MNELGLKYIKMKNADSVSLGEVWKWDTIRHVLQFIV